MKELKERIKKFMRGPDGFLIVFIVYAISELLMFVALSTDMKP